MISRILYLILLFLTPSLEAQICVNDLAAQICKTPAPWKAAVTLQSVNIHKKLLSSIPNGNINNASHQDFIKYHEGFEKLIEQDLGLNKKDIATIFAEIKSSLISSVKNSNQLDISLKEKMIARLIASQYLLASEFLKAADPDESAYAILMSCGFGNQYDNAFTFTSRGWVIVCPARLVRIASVAKVDRLAVAIRGLAHELGHQIDSSRFIDAYANWSVCAKSQLSNLKSPFEKYLAELTADYWAAESVVQFVKMSGTQKFEQLELTYKDICGTNDNAPQPSYQNRINFGLKLNPSFNKHICNSAQILYCAL